MEQGNQKFSSFEEWVDGVAHQFFSFWYRHRVAILGTIVVNLLVAILFLLFELKGTPHPPDTVLLVDFDREYELFSTPEDAIDEPLLPADALDSDQEWEAIRNIAVDATKEDLNPHLSDEKAIDADELYQEAQRAREEMQRNREMWEQAQDPEAAQIPNVEQKQVEPSEMGKYTGPTVISYFLENRRALRVPVPAYKCEGGGQVVVDIEVMPNGKVSKASIDVTNSVIDDCMNSAALAAARLSVFSSSSGAPPKQKGSITYLFVAQ